MENAIIWSPGMTLDALEKQVILKAFRFYRGNKTQTANALGISIRTLDNKLERYEDEGKKEEDAQNERKRNSENYLARARGNIQIDPETGSTVYGPAPGVRMEPAIKATEKQPLPVSKREEVQSVSPKQAPTYRDGSSGKPLPRPNGKA